VTAASQSDVGLGIRAVVVVTTHSCWVLLRTLSPLLGKLLRLYRGQSSSPPIYRNPSNSSTEYARRLFGWVPAKMLLA
jgi:hypothetical protein